jgi:hypothetical protein
MPPDFSYFQPPTVFIFGMKIVNVNSHSLTDYEVLDFLNEPIKSHLQKGIEFEDFRTMLHTTKKFLKNDMMPCSKQSFKQIQNVLQALMKFKLTKLEKLMLVNTRPFTIVELVPLIEDLDARFNTKDQDAILAVLEKCLPFERPKDEDEDE